MPTPRTYRRPQAPNIDLFPFLSVLACTIGSLILLIVVITSQTLSDEKTVTIEIIDEEGSNKTKVPRYVECGQEGVIIYPDETKVSLSDLNVEGSAFRKLLEELETRRDQEYIILAIKPDGYDIFYEARKLVEERRIDLGYEPIDEGWKLRVKRR